MTVEHLIKELSKYNKDKIVVLTEPDLVVWDNIGEGSTIKISFERLKHNNPYLTRRGFLFSGEWFKSDTPIFDYLHFSAVVDDFILRIYIRVR